MRNLEDFYLEKKVAKLNSNLMSKVKGTSSSSLLEGDTTFNKYWTAGNGEVSKIGCWDPDID